mmetsp:Transcript_16925/g.32051  ORF Transcript_16925/g.32051 Transcript_16925/m.32051 type:complete len:447 (+) Transcript_16925:105-1445(+)
MKKKTVDDGEQHHGPTTSTSSIDSIIITTKKNSNGTTITSSNNDADRDDDVNYDGTSSCLRSTSTIVVAPHENDILLGRGGNNNKHSGNDQLRALARDLVLQYMKSSKKGKSHLSMLLVRQVRQMNPPGRFLKQHRVTREWMDVGDKLAREKASQVLRDAIMLGTDMSRKNKKKKMPNDNSKDKSKSKTANQDRKVPKASTCPPDSSRKTNRRMASTSIMHGNHAKSSNPRRGGSTTTSNATSLLKTGGTSPSWLHHPCWKNIDLTYPHYDSLCSHDDLLPWTHHRERYLPAPRIVTPSSSAPSRHHSSNINHKRTNNVKGGATNMVTSPHSYSSQKCSPFSNNSSFSFSRHRQYPKDHPEGRGGDLEQQEQVKQHAYYNNIASNYHNDDDGISIQEFQQQQQQHQSLLVPKHQEGVDHHHSTSLDLSHFDSPAFIHWDAIRLFDF